MVFGGQNVLRLGSNLILTRILFPEAFGLAALAHVIIAGMNLFSDIGMSSAVIRSPRGDDPVFLDTAWVFQVVRGLLLYGLLFVIAPLAAGFYGEPILTGLIYAAGAQIVFAGFTSIGVITANRDLQLGRISVLQLISQVLGISVMIGLAIWWESVWALAVGGAMPSMFMMIFSHTMLRPEKRRFRVERAAFNELFHFGKWIFVSTVATFFIMHGDRALLGKFVSLEELALYGIALVLSMAAIEIINRINFRVIFPLYAKRPPGESIQNRNAVWRARRLVTLGAFGIFAILAFIGDPTIRFLYDPRYEAAGPMLVLLALCSLPAAILISYPRAMAAAGHTRRFAAYQICIAALQTAFLFFGIQMIGVAGAALARPAALLAAYPVLFILMKPFGGINVKSDLGFALLTIAITAITVQLHGPILADLF